MIIWRCDRCKAMEDAATKTGAKPKGWTLGIGEDLCAVCSRERKEGTR